MGNGRDPTWVRYGWILRSKVIRLLSFLHRVSTCPSQERAWSNVTPSTLASVTCSTLLSLTATLRDWDNNETSRCPMFFFFFTVFAPVLAIKKWSWLEILISEVFYRNHWSNLAQPLENTSDRKWRKKGNCRWISLHRRACFTLCFSKVRFSLDNTERRRTKERKK